MQSVSLTAQTNLVTNGSFEDVGEDGRPTGWEYYGENVIYGVSTDVSDIPEGTKVLNVDVTSTGGQARDFSQIISGIVAGETYNFSFWYNVYRDPSKTTEGLSYTIAWLTETGGMLDAYTYFSEDPLPYVKDVWIPIENELVAPEGAVTVLINTTITRNIGVYIDDVKFLGPSSGPNGIEKIIGSKKAELPVRRENGQLIVSVAAGSRIDVFTVLGSRLQSVVSSGNETTLSGLPKGEILIVRSGNAAAKTIIN